MAMGALLWLPLALWTPAVSGLVLSAISDHPSQEISLSSLAMLLTTWAVYGGV